MSPPYLVRATGPGEADVVDRATGERVGYLRADFHQHWRAFSLGPAGGDMGTFRYRADAARAVWDVTR